MKIAFHGAARVVTGSKHLIKLDNGTKILLDCGMFQGMGEQTDILNGYFGFKPSEITMVILSHAHIDHCGLLPRLVAEGFEGTIYSTPPTMDLARILLLDSANIHEQDAEFANENKNIDEPEQLPLFTQEDVIKTMGMFKVIDYGQEIDIDKCIKLSFTDAGHVVGSAAVHLKIIENGKQKAITFSGDIGRYSDLLLRSPQVFQQSDYILLESTYGDSLHKDQLPIEDMLLEIINDTCAIKKGKVLIPAFSVGRTQELLFALNSLELKGKLPDIPYYVDSPLATQATQVLRNHPDVFNNGVKQLLKVDDDVFNFKGLRFIDSPVESRKLSEDPRPCVIIASSGMAEGGRIRHHIKSNIENQKNTILIVGYCDPNSLGGKLLAGERNVQIFKQYYHVNAEIKVVKSMSAHGDYQDLLHFMSCQDPTKNKQVFLVHGEYATQQKLADRLREKGFKHIAIPEYRQEYDID
ncbi:MBL fold metallo-hydrolase RNA specificity domain-containing protein [Pedobacter sp. UC225_61]|uniref:MBL fold metallo-hydrolase RNA specificity domain-containing protein n=1 Tax=Pedobacter sp. UC225_61 TaxID=3374623 RepID=UPI00378E15B3